LPDYTAPDFERSALIIADVQNDFALPGAPAEMPGTMKVIPNIQRLANVYRHYHRPVVHVVRLYLADGSNAELCRKDDFEKGRAVVVPGTEGAEIVRDLKPTADTRLDADLLLSGEFQEIGEKEWIVYKPRWGAFYQTILESRLRKLDVNTLAFAGCNFPNCPRTTIYEAGERDFRIAMAEDAVSGLYDRGVQEMRGIGVHVMSTQSILDALMDIFH